MIQIHKESSSLIWQTASSFLTDTLRLNSNISQKTLLLLSGGSATHLYSLLAKFLQDMQLPENLLTVAQVDERFHPVKESRMTMEINEIAIGKTGLWRVCQVKKIPYFTISQEGTLEQAAHEYDVTMGQCYNNSIYKIAVLGIGEDGHTGGLLPGYKNRWDKDEYVISYHNKGAYPNRISLTPYALTQLDQALVVAAGKQKKDIVPLILDGRNKKKIDEYPAVLLHSIPKVDLFTDFD